MRSRAKRAAPVSRYGSFHRGSFEASLLHEEWRSVRAPACAGASPSILIHNLDELSGERDAGALSLELGNPHGREAHYRNGHRCAAGAVPVDQGYDHELPVAHADLVVTGRRFRAGSVRRHTDPV